MGVELAAEIIEAYPSKPLTLVTSGAALCSTLPARVGQAARAWLEARGVAIRFHAPVAAVDASKGVVQLQGGEDLTAGIVYDCRGNGPPHSTSLTGEGSALASASDDKGRLAADDHLQVRLRSEEAAPQPIRIFAAGDAMRLAGCNDLKVGHTAELNADVVAANIRLAAAADAAAAAADAADADAADADAAADAAVNALCAAA